MIIRHGFRKSSSPRSGLPGRGDRPIARASDIILVMMAGLLVIACILKVLQG